MLLALAAFLLTFLLLTGAGVLTLGLLLAGRCFLALTGGLIAAGRCRLTLSLRSTGAFFLSAATGTTLLALIGAQLIENFGNLALRVVVHARDFGIKERAQVIEMRTAAAEKAVQLVAPAFGSVGKILADVFAFFRSNEEAYAYAEKKAIDETSHSVWLVYCLVSE